MATKKTRFDSVKEGSPPSKETTRSLSNRSLDNKDLRHVLQDTKARDIPFEGKSVVEVRADMTPLQSATVLWEHKILGAPVWDDKKQTYVGFFDMRDLISTVLVQPKQQQKPGDKSDAAASANTRWFPERFTTSYLAARNPFVATYNLDSSLLELCQALSHKDMHRVPLVDPQTGRCVRIVSQSALVQFLAQHLTTAQQFPALDQTLAQAHFPYLKKVLQAPDTATARQVFTLMDQHRLSGIAIVDHDTGKLVGNTSAIDIKVAVRLDDHNNKEADMDMDVLSYLAAVRQEHATKQDTYPSAHVRESSSTVGHAIRLLAKTGFHRVFVVDDQVRPVGVISVTDVVQFVVKRAAAATTE